MSRLSTPTLTALLLGLLLSLLPGIGMTLGFGPVKLYSYLNEPLDAEVEILAVEDVDVGHLVASLASSQDFKRVEMARPYLLSKLRFDVSQKNKKTFIRITSEDAIKAPYLEFLMVLTWPQGRLVRGYTLLLDPAPFGSADKRPQEETQPKAMTSSAMDKESEKSPSIEGQDKQSNAGRGSLKTARGNRYKEELENLFDPKDNAENELTILSHETASVSAKKYLSNGQDVQSSNEPRRHPRNSAGFTEEYPEDEAAIGSSELEMASQTSSLMKNKLLLGSGFALLFSVAFTVWALRRARSSLPIMIVPRMQEDALGDSIEKAITIPSALDLLKEEIHAHALQASLANSTETKLSNTIESGNTESSPDSAKGVDMPSSILFKDGLASQEFLKEASKDSQSTDSSFDLFRSFKECVKDFAKFLKRKEVKMPLKTTDLVQRKDKPFKTVIATPKNLLQMEKTDSDENDLFDNEVMIKLSLAQQYLEIRDVASAREILEEVMVRGNKKEKEMASALIQKLSA